MSLLQSARASFERLLEAIVIALVAALTAMIVAGFVFRYAGHSLVWYDELASIGLVWLTYYGSALAALRGAHIGVTGVVNAMPPRARLIATVFAELCVFVFFILLAVTGTEVLAILGDDRMVSLAWVPLRLTQSVIPVGAGLFIIAEALRLPTVLHEARTRGFIDVEVKEALELAQQVPADGATKAGEPR